MRVILAALLLLAFALPVAGDSAPVSAGAQSEPQACLAAAGGDPIAQAGCCKGHKGVCGCRAGRIVCCDKSFDRSCRCNRDDPPATS